MKKLFTKMSIQLMLLSAFFIIANSAQAASYFYGAVYFGVDSSNYDDPESDINARYVDTAMINIYNRNAERIPANIVSTVYSDSCGYFEAYLPAGFYDIVVSSQAKNVKYISQCWITDTSYNVNGARENCALAFWPVNINIFVIQ